MILRYFGHSLFTLELGGGMTILTDPYGRFCRYPRRDLKADIVTISHHHYDHNALEIVEGKPMVLDEAGYYLPVEGVVVTSIPTFHDNHTGARRGKNMVFVIEAEGLKVVHLGDLGHLLDDEQLAKIGTPDLLLIPVGGTFTLDAARASQCVDQLKPKITIPMHYQTRFSEDLGIATQQEFLRLRGASPQPQKQLCVTKETIGEFPALLLMDIIV